MLSCHHPAPVNHAEWDFHGHRAGTPTLVYDGYVVNPNPAGKYHVDCNLSRSTVCNLRINRLQDTDVGEYQCYFRINNETLKFVYIVSVIGNKKCQLSHIVITCRLTDLQSWRLTDLDLIAHCVLFL